MADNGQIWNLETCKKNALKFKVKVNVGNLQEECFTSLKSKQTLETCKWVVIPKIGKVSQRKSFPIKFVFDRKR